MRLHLTTRARALVGVLGAAALMVGTIPGSPAHARSTSAAVAAAPLPAVAAPAGAEGEYLPVNPERIVDTRSGLGGRTGKVAIDEPFDVTVVGQADVPATGVMTVVVNVTVVDPTFAGYLSVYPSDATVPLASNVNFKAGQVVPNLVLARVSATGSIRMLLGPSGSGSAHLLVDVMGWFASSSAAQRGARLTTTTPTRVLDTRTGQGASGPVGPNSSITLGLRGVAPVPSSSTVTAVVLNVTGAEPTKATYVRVEPAAEPAPGGPATPSNLNLVAGQTRPNLVMAKLDTSGQIRLYNYDGQVHLIADVVGYFTTGHNDASRQGRVIPLSTPFRVLDTRTSGGRLGTGQAEEWDFAPFLASLSWKNEPVGPVEGVVANLTGTDLQLPWYLVNYPTFLSASPIPWTQVPSTSNLNLKVGEDVPNLMVTQLGEGAASSRPLSFYNHLGDLHYLADVAAIVLAD